MRRCWDQAHRAAELTASAMIGTNCEQSREFTLRSGIRLQRNRIVAGDRDQLGFEVGDHLHVALCLLAGRKRMQIRKARPSQRHHFGCGVEFHCAGAQRDHRPVKGKVAIRQTAQVAEHLRLRSMLHENRMGHERAGAP